MKTPLAHFYSRRVAGWQSEWEFLRCSLAREPDATQAWWWKIRLRVLAFVIARYGADSVVRARDHALEPHASDSDLTFGERRTVEPRPRATLAAHLQSIAEANDFPRPPAPRDDDDSLLQRWYAAHQRQWRVGVRFIYGAVFGMVLGGNVAIATGVRDSFEICAYVSLGWVIFGTLAVFFGGWLSNRIARLLIKW